MYCRDCPRYDPQTRKCRDGKVNPQKYELAVDVANVLGVRAICTYNDFRERLVLSRRRQTEAEPPAEASE